MPSFQPHNNPLTNVGYIIGEVQRRSFLRVISKEKRARFTQKKSGFLHRNKASLLCPRVGAAIESINMFDKEKNR
jgi:hypothetical protein